MRPAILRVDGRWHVAVVARPAGVAGQRFRTWLVQGDGVDVSSSTSRLPAPARRTGTGGATHFCAPPRRWRGAQASCGASCP
eukprot:1690355-Lingulodinium_polyedra.AAC.1